MNIVVNGILTDYLTLWKSDVDLVVVSFSEKKYWVPYCRILVATIGLVKAHRMIRTSKNVSLCKSITKNDNQPLQKPKWKATCVLFGNVLDLT